jgi:acyl-CoA reductase-like NAD-dependent aldehyde dehydrogenase
VSYTIINPATGEAMETVEHASVDQTDDAIERARVAQKVWAALAPAERAEALRAFARAVEGDIEHLAQLEVRNSGHPVGQARWEATHVRNVLDYYSAAPERLLGKQIPVAGGIDITFNEPLGVVGVITPWNFPMTIASWGFVPALAAGNAVVLKPAEWTPLTSLRLAELGTQSGLPEGLFHVLAGKGSVVGERFITNPDVRKVVFTGSTEVGKTVMRGAADQIKRVTLELGGCALFGVRKRGTGLLCAQPHSGSEVGSRRVHGEVRNRREERRGRRPHEGCDGGRPTRSRETPRIGQRLPRQGRHRIPG